MVATRREQTAGESRRNAGKSGPCGQRSSNFVSFQGVRQRGNDSHRFGP